jgi:hypothetical protein
MEQAEFIPLFPTMVYHSQIQDNESYKKIVFDEDVFSRHGFKVGGTPKNEHETLRTLNATSGEYRGKVLLHKDPRFVSLFKEITAHAVVYLNGTFNIVTDMFDFYIIKSWYAILPPGKEMSFHRHGSADLSFVYYPETDEHTSPIWFSNIDGKLNNHNEIFSGLFSENIDRKNFITHRNEITSLVNSILPGDGSIVIFPSKTLHGVCPLPNQHGDKDRISIAGDIKIVLKPEYLNLESGLISIEHWKKFNG